MAYLEKIKRGKRTYYYLTKNIRLSDAKWKKVREFLGDKEPTNADIKKYAKIIEQRITKLGIIKDKPSYLFLAEKDAELLEDLKESYKDWLDHTPNTVKEKLDEDFVIRFTYNTNAIEGNKLTLRQTALILKDKIMPSGASANDYNEAINGKECLEYIKSYKGEFNQKLLLAINQILTKNTRVANGGKIRFFDVKIEGSTHVPPKHGEVKHHLLNLYKWYSAYKNKLHPFELAALLHYRITWIHPFEDGNGRTARAIMNFILLKKGYPMFFIPDEKRESYYMALEDADNKDYKRYTSEMLALITDQMTMYSGGHK